MSVQRCRSGLSRVRLALLVLSALLLSGCWDSRPISNRAIVLAIYVTPADHEGVLRWTFLMPNVTVTVSSLASMSPQQQYFSAESEATSLPAAVGALQHQLSRSVYLGHLRLVIWSPRLTSQEVLGLVDDLNKAPIVPNEYNTVVGERSLLASFRSPQETVPDIVLDKYLTCKQCQLFDLRTQGWQAWSSDVTPGISLVVPAASRPTVIDRLAVYEQGHPLPALMGPFETEGWAYLMNKVQKATLQVATPHGAAALETITARTTSRVHLHGAAILLEADVRARGVSASMRGPHTIASDEQIRSAAAHAVLQRCLAAIAWANRTRTDPFGFGRRLIWQGELAAGQGAAVLPIEAVVRVHFVVHAEGES